MKTLESSPTLPSQPYVERPEDKDKFKEVDVQVGWAEHGLGKSTLVGMEREQAIAALMLDRGKWFREEVLEKEENRGVILHNYPEKKEDVFRVLDEHFRDTGNLQ